MQNHIELYKAIADRDKVLLLVRQLYPVCLTPDTEQSCVCDPVAADIQLHCSKARHLRAIGLSPHRDFPQVNWFGSCFLPALTSHYCCAIGVDYVFDASIGRSIALSQWYTSKLLSRSLVSPCSEVGQSFPSVCKKVDHFQC